MESPPVPQLVTEKGPASRFSSSYAGVFAVILFMTGIALGCYFPRRPVSNLSNATSTTAAQGVPTEAYTKLAWDITGKHGWHDAHMLLHDILPEMVRQCGARAEIREIAIAALSRNASATIPSPGNITIFISPDERWLILNGLAALLFFDLEHPDGNFYLVSAEARQLSANGGHLFYQERGQWKKRLFESDRLSMYRLGLPQEIASPPAAEPTSLPPTPLQARIDQKGMVRLYDSVSTPVRILGEVQAKSATISPRGRWLVIQEKTGVIRLWDLAKLRLGLAKLNLDWPIPPVKSQANPDREAVMLTLTGEDVTQIQPVRLQVPDQVLPTPEKERRKVILPAPKKPF